MKTLLNLGGIYVSDFLKPGQLPGIKHELKLVLDEAIGAPRLETTVPVNNMFGKYWYQSGTNETMKSALKDVVDSILPHMKTDHPTWLDIACNDGTLLSFVPKMSIKWGVDPCEDSIIKKALVHADFVINDYFSKTIFHRYIKFDVITTIAMFYDIEDYNTFVKDVYEVLEDDGIWVLQLSYTPLMIEQLAFDNILSEHVYYHSLSSMIKVLEPNGFKVVDCQLNDVNGGSMRLFVKKGNSDFGTQAYRDVCNFRIDSLLNYEKTITWDNFDSRLQSLKKELTTFIKKEVAAGKTIMGYGASTKGNTLLQYFELDNKLITAIAERQECKYGLVTVGTNIPIISEQEMRDRKPDYLLILPWHFVSEFTEREAEYLKAGGKFIVPLPKLVII